jgi:formylglycine-generating enzyme required for sulfatase activity
MSTGARWKVVQVAWVLLVGCGGVAPLAGAARPPAFDPDNQTKASVVRSELRPLIIDWPGQDIALLEGQSKTGLVVVRYAARQIELLATCHADGSYKYVPTTRQDEHLTLHDRAELQAQLPLGAARLEADLARAGELVVKTSVVGLYRTDRAVTRAELKGEDCDRATHVVRGISVGAFRFLTGADARAGAGASTLLGAGAKASAESDRETESTGGREQACDQATAAETAPPSGCGSPLRLELAEVLEERPLARACAGDTVWNGSACVARAPAAGAPRASDDARPMAHVPAEQFAMGSADGDPFDGPKHAVAVAAFDIDVTEVTAGDYATCVAARRCAAPQAEISARCTWGKPERRNHPINCVRWEQANDYCAFVGKRLPTEAEWEYAARGPDERPYPWGSSPPGQRICWMREGTCEVGTYPDGKSPFGALDMAGGVAEWTADQACGYDGTRCQDAHVYRGGSWFSNEAGDVRSTARGFRGPIPRDDVGVRCARDAR